jgi:hypothetical protein
MGGVDIHAYPNYHVPYDTVRKDVAAKGKPLEQLTRFNKGLSIAALAASLGRAEKDIKFLPLRAGKVDLTVLVDANDGTILRIADLKPWEYE